MQPEAVMMRTASRKLPVPQNPPFPPKKTQLLSRDLSPGVGHRCAARGSHDALCQQEIAEQRRHQQVLKRKQRGGMGETLGDARVGGGCHDGGAGAGGGVREGKGRLDEREGEGGGGKGRREREGGVKGGGGQVEGKGLC